MFLTSTLANLSVAPPEDSNEWGSVMRSSPDVVKLSEENVVTVLHTAETTNTHIILLQITHIYTYYISNVGRSFSKK